MLNQGWKVWYNSRRKLYIRFLISLACFQTRFFQTQHVPNSTSMEPTTLSRHSEIYRKVPRPRKKKQKREEITEKKRASAVGEKERGIGSDGGTCPMNQGDRRPETDLEMWKVPTGPIEKYFTLSLGQRRSRGFQKFNGAAISCNFPTDNYNLFPPEDREDYGCSQFQFCVCH